MATYFADTSSWIVLSSKRDQHCHRPIKVTLHSETRDGAWAGPWDIFPHYARFHRPPRPPALLVPVPRHARRLTGLMLLHHSPRTRPREPPRLSAPPQTSS